MTTRELLIREIDHAPEDVLQRTLRYLLTELKQRRQPQRGQTPQTAGPYADYWNQFIGAFSNEDWERPAQGTQEQREAW